MGGPLHSWPASQPASRMPSTWARISTHWFLQSRTRNLAITRPPWRAFHLGQLPCCHRVVPPISALPCRIRLCPLHCLLVTCHLLVSPTPLLAAMSRTDGKLHPPCLDLKVRCPPAAPAAADAAAQQVAAVGEHPEQPGIGGAASPDHPATGGLVHNSQALHVFVQY